MFEVSGKVARHAWGRLPPGERELTEERLPDALSPGPGDRLEQLAALSAAIGGLTERQREMFVAIALNDVPIHVLAIGLGSNRNAIYKILFDARRRLRARLADAGHRDSPAQLPRVLGRPRRSAGDRPPVWRHHARLSESPRAGPGGSSSDVLGRG